jgi:GT2 family glycosyltransferase
MDLSIIIVNWNGGEMLQDCLASIAAVAGDLKLQVIVVDNDSRDGSRETAHHRFPQFEVFNSGSNLGFARANNLARSRIKSDLVLFLNPDTILLKNSLHPMLEFIREHSEVGAVGCRMLYPDGVVHEQGLQYFPSPWTEFLNMLFLSQRTSGWLRRWLPYLDPNQSGYVIKLYGGCLLCRKEILDQVGWFDERYFMYAEDVDLCWAILKQGAKLYYLSSADIIHIAGGTSKKASSGFSILMKSESITKLMRKHYGAFGAVVYRLATLVSSAFRLLVLLLLRTFWFLFRSAEGNDFAGGFFKHRTLILWSLGLKSATIAR